MTKTTKNKTQVEPGKPELPFKPAIFCTFVKSHMVEVQPVLTQVWSVVLNVLSCSLVLQVNNNFSGTFILDAYNNLLFSTQACT